MALENTASPGSDERREFTFPLDGETFKVVLALDEADFVFTWSELAEAADESDVDVNSAAGAAFLARFFKLVMGPDEYRRFRVHMKTHGMKSERLLPIMQSINDAYEKGIEEQTGRPTMPFAPSSPGQEEKAERTLKIISMGGDGDVQFTAPPPPGLQHPTVREEDNKPLQATLAEVNALRHHARTG